MDRKVVVLILANIGLSLVQGFDDPICEGDRTVMVHLFNWKHSDVALECERWLGPKGFCAAQVSPAQEHPEFAVTDDPSQHRPWWERYQPVSYILGSRSGNREEFIDMVNRCNAVGVKIYADMVINHMAGSYESGTGSAGSYYNGATLEFPHYAENDFNCCENNGQGNCVDGAKCESDDCNVIDGNNPAEVRNCRLYSLTDLAVGIPQVQEQIRNYFYDLIDIGIVGFRIDAGKHMWPNDTELIWGDITLPDGSKPFMFIEVIDLGTDVIKGDEYFHIGRVTEFEYSNAMFGFRGNFPLAQYQNFGEEWGLYPSNRALVFVDNHDNQRGHGAGGEDVITFYEPYIYKMATAFALAHPYGHVRIMSSYVWPGGRLENDGYGPPTNDGHDIKTVEINPDESCGDGSDHTWVCEHRWRSIANMVEWRNVVGGGGVNDQVDNWWSNGNNQIAFSRSGAGFIAFNNEGFDMSESLQTGLPAGTYCNIIKANIDDCAEFQVTVDGTGLATINIPGGDIEPMVAIHTGPGSLISSS